MYGFEAVGKGVLGEMRLQGVRNRPGSGGGGLEGRKRPQSMQVVVTAKAALGSRKSESVLREISKPNTKAGKHRFSIPTSTAQLGLPSRRRLDKPACSMTYMGTSMYEMHYIKQRGCDIFAESGG